MNYEWEKPLVRRLRHMAKTLEYRLHKAELEDKFWVFDLLSDDVKGPMTGAQVDEFFTALKAERKAARRNNK